MTQGTRALRTCCHSWVIFEVAQSNLSIENIIAETISRRWPSDGGELKTKLADEAEERSRLIPLFSLTTQRSRPSEPQGRLLPTMSNKCKENFTIFPTVSCTLAPFFTTGACVNTGLEGVSKFTIFHSQRQSTTHNQGTRGVLQHYQCLPLLSIFPLVWFNRRLLVIFDPQLELVLFAWH